MKRIRKSGNNYNNNRISQNKKSMKISLAHLGAMYMCTQRDRSDLSRAQNEFLQAKLK